MENISPIGIIVNGVSLEKGEQHMFLHDDILTIVERSFRYQLDLAPADEIATEEKDMMQFTPQKQIEKRSSSSLTHESPRRLGSPMRVRGASPCTSKLAPALASPGRVPSPCKLGSPMRVCLDSPHADLRVSRFEIGLQEDTITVQSTAPQETMLTNPLLATPPPKPSSASSPNINILFPPTPALAAASRLAESVSATDAGPCSSPILKANTLGRMTPTREKSFTATPQTPRSPRYSVASAGSPVVVDSEISASPKLHRVDFFDKPEHCPHENVTEQLVLDEGFNAETLLEATEASERYASNAQGEAMCVEELDTILETPKTAQDLDTGSVKTLEALSETTQQPERQTEADPQTEANSLEEIEENVEAEMEEPGKVEAIDSSAVASGVDEKDDTQEAVSQKVPLMQQPTETSEQSQVANEGEEVNITASSTAAHQSDEMSLEPGEQDCSVKDNEESVSIELTDSRLSEDAAEQTHIPKDCQDPMIIDSIGPLQSQEASLEAVEQQQTTNGEESLVLVAPTEGLASNEEPEHPVIEKDESLAIRSTETEPSNDQVEEKQPAQDESSMVIGFTNDLGQLAEPVEEQDKGAMVVESVEIAEADQCNDEESIVAQLPVTGQVEGMDEPTGEIQAGSKDGEIVVMEPAETPRPEEMDVAAINGQGSGKSEEPMLVEQELIGSQPIETGQSDEPVEKQQSVEDSDSIMLPPTKTPRYEESDGKLQDGEDTKGSENPVMETPASNNDLTEPASNLSSAPSTPRRSGRIASTRTPASTTKAVKEPKSRAKTPRQASSEAEKAEHEEEVQDGLVRRSTRKTPGRASMSAAKKTPATATKKTSKTIISSKGSEADGASPSDHPQARRGKIVASSELINDKVPSEDAENANPNTIVKYHRTPAKRPLVEISEAHSEEDCARRRSTRSRTPAKAQ